MYELLNIICQLIFWLTLKLQYNCLHQSDSCNTVHSVKWKEKFTCEVNINAFKFPFRYAWMHQDIDLLQVFHTSDELRAYKGKLTEN